METFTEAEQNWSTLEQELFAVVWSIRKWQSMLDGCTFTVFSDHRNILQLAKATAPKVVRWRLMVQPFNFTVLHVPGLDEKHAVADCLSRLHASTVTRKLSVSAVTRSKSRQVIVQPAGQLQITSQNDDKRAKSFQIAGRPGACNELSACKISDQSVNRLASRSQNHEAGAARFGVSAEEMDQWMQAVKMVHSDEAGHLGVKAMYTKLQRYFVQKQIAVLPSKDFLNWYRKSCSMCQKMHLLQQSSPPTARASLSVKYPFDEVSIDVLGPLTKTEDDFEYAIVAVEGFSKFVWAAPIKDTSARSATAFLLSLGSTFPYPKAFRWDNASQFSGHLVKALCKLLKIDRHCSIAFNPQSNGLIERAIKEVIKHLRILVNSRRDKKSWPYFLQMVVRILNTTPHTAVGRTPAEILLPGYQVQQRLLPSEEGMEVVKPSIDLIVDAQARLEVSKWIQHLCAVQADAVRATSKFSEAMLAKQDRLPEGAAQPFKLGEYVLTTWRGGPPDKLSIRLPGPYKIVKIRSNHRYDIQDPADDRILENRHARELFAYNLREGDDPVDIIAMDEEEHIVDSVVDHFRTVPGSTNISDIDYRVRFKGQPESEDRWFSHRQIMRKGGLKAFWDYVEQHPELKIQKKG